VISPYEEKINFCKAKEGRKKMYLSDLNLSQKTQGHRPKNREPVTREEENPKNLKADDTHLWDSAKPKSPWAV